MSKTPITSSYSRSLSESWGGGSCGGRGVWSGPFLLFFLGMPASRRQHSMTQCQMASPIEAMYCYRKHGRFSISFPTLFNGPCVAEPRAISILDRNAHTHTHTVVDGLTRNDDVSAAEAVSAGYRRSRESLSVSPLRYLLRQSLAYRPVWFRVFVVVIF